MTEQLAHPGEGTMTLETEVKSLVENNILSDIQYYTVFTSTNPGIVQRQQVARPPDVFMYVFLLYVCHWVPT